MIKIKAPATSANLSVGFDTLALAYDIYNVFTFTESEDYQTIGFDDAFNNEQNLVLRSYLYASSLFLDEKDIKKVTITLEEENIPVSRGLGSSASCIIAGVIAANKINNLNKTNNELATLAYHIETHYDNVVGAMIGGLSSSYLTDNIVKYDTFEIASNLVFTLLIPDTLSSTSEMRSGLGDAVALGDAVFHLSRMIHLPKAFKEGNIQTLKELLQDRIHEHIRYQNIPMNDQLHKLTEENIVVSISGSGPTVLLISDRDITNLLTPFLKTFFVITPSISKGVIVEELS